MNGERAKDSINVGASVLLHTYLKIDDQVKYISLDVMLSLLCYEMPDGTGHPNLVL